MATIHFTTTTTATPEQFTAAVTDFGPGRSELFGNTDDRQLKVHDQGPNWADVTEGNVLAWERNRYEWNAGAGEVTVTAVESDSWAPGSQWRYRLQPSAAGGTQVDVTAVRTGRGLRGRLLGSLLGVFGVRVLRSDMEKVLARVR